MVCLDAISGDVNWRSSWFDSSDIKIHQSGEYLLIDSDLSTDKGKDLHTFVSLDKTTGKTIWVKTLPDEYLEDESLQALQVFTDSDSFLIWNRKEKELLKISASNGKIVAYSFHNKNQVYVSAQVFSSADHTYIQINEWEKNYSDIKQSSLYEIENQHETTQLSFSVVLDAKREIQLSSYADIDVTDYCTGHDDENIYVLTNQGVLLKHSVDAQKNLLIYNQEFKKTYPTLFKGEDMWSLDRHRKKFMDWRPQRTKSLPR